MKKNSIINDQVTKKIVIILPIEYRGGSLRGAISLANSLVRGADSLKDRVEVVFAYLDMPDHYPDSAFTDLDLRIARRAYRWKMLDALEAKRAMSYAGNHDWNSQDAEYFVPDDGINYFLDCDLWLIISDRLDRPLLPIRSYVLMVYDYIQRYVSFLPHSYEQKLFYNAHQAHCVLTTTGFTANDAKQYVGLKASNVFKMPMLVPDFKVQLGEQIESKVKNYFIWTTNPAFHKNHLNTFTALQIYYEELGGTLECHITGANSNELLKYHPYLENILNNSPITKKKIHFCSELSDIAYKNTLRRAAFLLHSASIDNGTFSVIEAAQSGVPSLSSDYPPMREIDERFQLNLTWMDSTNPHNMATNLKKMEENYPYLTEEIAKKDVQQFMHSHAEEIYYWEVIKSCL